MNLSEYFNILFSDFLASLITILGILLLIPLYVMFQSYRVTKSSDYLYLMGIFFFFPLHWITRPIHNFVELTTRLWFVSFITIASFCIIMHTLRLRWDKPIPWLYGILLAELLAFFGVGIYWSFDPTILPNFWMFYEPIRLTMGVLILYTYSTFDPVVDDSMTMQSKRLWQLFGIFAIYAGITYFLVNLPNAPEYPFIIRQGASLQNIYMMGFLLYLGVRYPQYLLISKSQVVRACNAYKLVHVLDDTGSFSGARMDTLRNYILNIPESVFDDSCTTQTVLKTVPEGTVIA